MRHSRSFMDAPSSELHSSNWRMGRHIAESGVKVFQIETTLNTDTFPSQFAFLQRREWEWTLRDRATYAATAAALDATPAGCRARSSTRSSPPRPDLGAGGRGGGGARARPRELWRQQGVEVEGQTDILTMGLPYICPYNVQLDHEPDPRGLPRARVLLQPLPGQAPRAPGRSADHAAPDPGDFDPAHHPSYIDFYEQVLTETTDPAEMHKLYEESFATDPWYIHLYRTGHAYHGVHPFYMWYWCAHALEHLGRVIVLGGDPTAVRRLGLLPGDLARRRARDRERRGGAVAHAHPPARPAAPAGRRPVSAPTR